MYTSACCDFVPCVPNFFQETYTERIQGMEAVPITDEKGKGKRRKKKPATQESSWNSPQLPNMTEKSQMRWEGVNKTNSVQYYLPTDWNKSRGKAYEVQKVLESKGASCNQCCCKPSRDGNLSDSFMLHFMDLLLLSLCRGVFGWWLWNPNNQSLAQGVFEVKAISTCRASCGNDMNPPHLKKHRTELHLFLPKQ